MLKTLLIGNLGGDATVNQVNGKSVINFSVAHTESWVKDGEKKQKTVWVSCAYWTDKHGVVPYLKKGVQVYVEGQPAAEGYTSKDGEQKVSLRLTVNTIQLLSGGKQDAGESDNYSPAGSNDTGSAALPPKHDLPPVGGDDDLPF